MDRGRYDQIWQRNMLIIENHFFFFIITRHLGSVCVTKSLIILLTEAKTHSASVDRHIEKREHLIERKKSIKQPSYQHNYDNICIQIEDNC